MKKLSIVIPAYNEERRIGKTLEKYSEYYEGLRKRGDLDYEILVVINGTTDDTEKIVKEIMEENERVRYLNLVRGGKGFATIEGFKDALKKDFDLIGFVDADMATLPEHFHELIKKLGSHDAAIASRYIKGAVISPKPSIKRLIAKRAFNILVRGLLFLPYKDTQCGAKIFRREALERVVKSLTISEWAFDVDLLHSARKRGFRIKEVPTVWEDKDYSTINFWKAGPWMALGVVRLRLLNSPVSGFTRVYDRFIGYFPR